MKIVMKIAPKWTITSKMLVTLREDVSYNAKTKSRFKKDVYWRGTEGYPSLEEAVEGMEDSGDFFIGKPFTYQLFGLGYLSALKRDKTGIIHDLRGITKKSNAYHHRVFLEGAQDQPKGILITLMTTTGGEGGREFSILGGEWNTFNPQLEDIDFNFAQATKAEEVSFRIVRKR